jgi:hypothetical protein
MHCGVLVNTSVLYSGDLVSFLEPTTFYSDCEVTYSCSFIKSLEISTGISRLYYSE